MLPRGCSQGGDRQISISSDTGFFDPGLPGEVVRLRFPAYGAVYLLAWAVIAVLVFGGLYQLFSGMPVPDLARDLVGPAGVIGLMAAALIAFYTRWRIVVTNRRVMMRPGFLTWKYEAIRREEIEAIAIGGDRISVRGSGGRELSAMILPLTALSVAHAIGIPCGIAKATDAPPEDLLEPGETVRYREPGDVESRLLRYRWLVIAGIFVATALLNRMFDLPAWADILFIVPIVILVSAGMPWRPVPWRLALTDRRLIVRWNMAGGPYLEEIRFEQVTYVWYDSRHRELIFDAPRRRLILPAGKKRARRILEMTGRAAEGLA